MSTQRQQTEFTSVTSGHSTAGMWEGDPHLPLPHFLVHPPAGTGPCALPVLPAARGHLIPKPQEVHTGLCSKR